MAVLVPKFSDEVQIVLAAIDKPASLSVPPLNNRHLLLSKENPTISIGRTSKRDVKFQPARNNAWIDSAVMSRAHAVLHFDVDQKKVFIKDVGSLHGTFCNGLRLARNQLQALEQGDMLRFGIAVERSLQAFRPQTMRVLITYGTETRPESKSIVFRVPDDTDVEDIASEDEFSIRSSIKVLRENGFHPAQPDESFKALAIDLTSEEDGNGFNFSDLRVIEGQRVEHGEWDSSSSVMSPATSAVQTPRVVNSTVTALVETPTKVPDAVLDDDEEVDGDESVDLDGAIGCGLATATLPAGLPSLTVGHDNVGPERPKTMPVQEAVATKDSAPSQHWLDPDGSVMFSSPVEHSTRGLEMQLPRASSPLFDETSAYQFELSKKAATATAEKSEQTRAEAYTCAERPPGNQSPLKRKAECISESAQEEERIGMGPCEEPACISPNQVICAAHTGSLKALMDEAAEDSRSTKRLRRAAEVFGYAAIGGVAVMSALIASAPAL